MHRIIYIPSSFSFANKFVILKPMLREQMGRVALGTERGGDTEDLVVSRYLLSFPLHDISALIILDGSTDLEFLSKCMWVS